MKKYLIATVLPVFFAAAACDDEKTEEPSGNPPTIEIGEVTCSETDNKASVEITPSEDTKTWYWKYVQTDGEGAEEASYTQVNGNTATTVTMDVEAGKAYTMTAYAENDFGKSKEVTKEFSTPSYEELMTDLVELNVKNLTPFSLDVEVTKSVKCSRYVIGAVLDTEDHPFSEEEFTEQAQTSLLPPEYGIIPFNTSEESATFTELTLNRGTWPNDESNNGISLGKLEGEKLMVACYAVPADGGEPKLYTKEVEMPAKGDYTGTIEAKVEIADEDLTLEKVAATISATAPCKMMVTIISELETKMFDAMTDDEKTEFLRKIAGGNNIPFPYTESFKREFKDYLTPNTEYQIVVVPIAENGKIGKVTIHNFTTKGPEFNGTGKIISAEILQTTHEYIHLKVNTEGATKVRILSCPDSDFDENLNTDDKLKLAMYEEATSGITKDYTVDDIKAGVELRVVTRAQGKPYRIYGATIDAQGGISEPVNIVKEFTDQGKDTYTTITEAAKPEIVFDGKGQLKNKMASVSDWSDDGTSYTLKTKPTLGTDCIKVWYYRFNGFLNDVEADAKEKFADYFTDGTVGAGVKEYSESQGLLEFKWMGTYSEQWGGDMVVFVTLDTDNKLKIYYRVHVLESDTGKSAVKWGM